MSYIGLKEYKEIVQFIRSLYKEPTRLIPLHAPVFRGNEKKYLNECIDTTFVSSIGKFVNQFEIGMAKYTRAKETVACVNGTSALHLALKLVGVEPGHEVITQPLTFVATANAITYCGAHPVFLDVDMDTMGLSPVNLEAWLKQNVILKNNKHKTKNEKQKTLYSERETLNINIRAFNKITGNQVTACVPVHTFGHPCRIDEIVEICNHYNIPVVEDAAESLGSFYKGQHTGTFGEIGVLSFNGNKIITTGGGGMLLFNDKELAKRTKHLTTQAKIQHPWEFSHDEVGYNYRMPNINAALGLTQLEQLPAFLQCKRKIAQAYKEFFTTLQHFNTLTLQSSAIKYMSEPPNTRSNYWLNCILMRNKEDRDKFLRYSNENGIMARPSWKLMNELPMFIHCQTDRLKNASEIAERLVNLPSSVLTGGD